jgi:exodeoxyribonuclease VII small subunit
LPLEELLAGYQRGQYLLDFCRERLAEVEVHLQKLDEDRSKGAKS